MAKQGCTVVVVTMIIRNMKRVIVIAMVHRSIVSGKAGVCRRSKLIICEDNILLCVWGEGVVIQNPFLR